MFSKTTEYALRAVIYIARNSSESKKIGLSEIADAIDSPQSFTAKILQVLTKEDQVICSVRGPNGGFYINKKQKALPVIAVLRAVEEKKKLEKCVLGLAECMESHPCPLHEEYKSIKKQLLRLFEQKTISDLMDKDSINSTFINNRKRKGK